jgi:hypothetical protein
LIPLIQQFEASHIFGAKKTNFLRVCCSMWFAELWLSRRNS